MKYNLSLLVEQNWTESPDLVNAGDCRGEGEEAALEYFLDMASLRGDGTSFPYREGDLYLLLLLLVYAPLVLEALKQTCISKKEMYLNCVFPLAQKCAGYKMILFAFHSSLKRFKLTNNNSTKICPLLFVAQSFLSFASLFTTSRL